MTAAIRLEGVGKRYRRLEETPTAIGRLVQLGERRRADTFWALRDVDALVQPGECVGVLGRNGAGKSTLLRLLAGVAAPTEGTVTVHGRVAPLLSVGVGFHQELTGRENVLVNGQVLGLTEQEVRRRFDEIVDFAGIEHFLDVPVKFYSSGMFVRLGFAVAVVATPDVLLVDEVLAVGDAEFQKRCLARMVEIANGGTTVVLVSHNVAAVKQICPRTVVLHHGAVAYDGHTEGAVDTYYGVLGGFGEDATSHLADVSDLRLIPATDSVRSGQRARLRLEVTSRVDLDEAVVWIGIGSPSLLPVYTELLTASPLRLAAGRVTAIEVALDLPLPDGEWTARLALRHPRERRTLAAAPPLSFRVTDAETVDGLVDLRPSVAARAVR